MCVRDKRQGYDVSISSCWLVSVGNQVSIIDCRELRAQSRGPGVEVECRDSASAGERAASLQSKSEPGDFALSKCQIRAYGQVNE